MKKSLAIILSAVLLVALLGAVPALADDGGVAVEIPAQEVTPEMVQGANYLVSMFPSLKQLVSASADGEALKLDPSDAAENAVRSGLASGSLLGVPVSEIPTRVVSALSGSELGRTLLGQISGLISSGEISVG